MIEIIYTIYIYIYIYIYTSLSLYIYIYIYIQLYICFPGDRSGIAVRYGAAGLHTEINVVGFWEDEFVRHPRV